MFNTFPRTRTLLTLTFFISLLCVGAWAKTTPAFNPEANCAYYADCTGAAQRGDLNNALLAKMAGILVIIALGTLYYYNKKKQVIPLIIGGSLSVVVVGATLLPYYIQPTDKERPCETVVSTVCFKADTTKADEFVSTSADFKQENVDVVGFIKQEVAIQNIDTFKADPLASGTTQTPSGSDEFSATSDEFSSNDSGSEAKNEAGTNDEFTQSADIVNGSTQTLNEPKGAISTENNSNSEKGASFEWVRKNEYGLLYQLIVIFILVALIGLLIRYAWFRNLRGYFLLVSVVYLGFVKGGCPCMIMSLQNVMLFIFGHDVSFVAMLWFLGLIPLTFFFGKIWCGWLCHLGALQELIFLPEKIDVLKTKKAQQWLRGIRIFFFVALIFQVAITQTNFYVRIDPFKVAFNLFSSNTTGYVLLVLLLLSSVLVYRPFCRSVCPVGLILGWVAKIPHAQTITKELSCIHCVTCSKHCLQHSMIYEQKTSYLSEQDCLFCGKCMGTCKKKSLNIKKRAIK